MLTRKKYLKEAEKTKRNKELYKDWKKGMSTIDLITKYRLSNARIYKILQKYTTKQS